MTQMSSKQHSKARASSLLVVLRVEEKPHLLTELITVMKEVEELKTLAEEMSAHLRKTQQGSPISMLLTVANRMPLLIVANHYRVRQDTR